MNNRIFSTRPILSAVMCCAILFCSSGYASASAGGIQLIELIAGSPSKDQKSKEELSPNGSGGETKDINGTRSLNENGIELYKQKRFDEAGKVLERADEISKSLQLPAVTADIENNLALVKWQNKEVDKAIKLLDQSITANEAELLSAKTKRGPKIRLVANYYNLAILQYMQAQHEQSRRLLQKALDIEHEELPSEDAILLATMEQLSTAASQCGAHQSACDLQRQLIDLRRRNGNSDELVQNYVNLAYECNSMSNYAGAEANYKTAMKEQERLTGAKSRPVLSISRQLADFYENRKNFTAAEQLLTEDLRAVSLTASESSTPELRESLESARWSLAEFYQRRKRYTEANKLYRTIIAAAGEDDRKQTDSSHKPPKNGLACLTADIAERFAAQGQNDEASNLFKRAVFLLQQGYSKSKDREEFKQNASDYTRVLDAYSEFLKKLGRKSEAAQYQSLSTSITKDYSRANSYEIPLPDPIFKSPSEIVGNGIVIHLTDAQP